MPAPRDQGVPVNVLQSLSVLYTGPGLALAGSLVSWDGSLSTGTSTPCMGALREDATPGRYASVAVAGVAEVISGGPLIPGNPVATDGTGRCILAGLGAHMLGRVMPGSVATAVGQRIQIYITREGTN
jgi:hypothetical protein